MPGPFTDEQLRTLTAAIDRIVPRDRFPSASEAGCLDFLLRLLPGEHQVEFYRSGLDALGAEARMTGTKFSGMDSEDQDALLADLQHGKASADWDVDPQEFVETLARQTIEGYYADPGNGANRDRIAWKMIGFEVRN